jgi:hypothetical protein
MPFKKGDPRPANAGRKPGTPNKVSSSVREALEMAFHAIGGDEAFAEWAQKEANKDSFFKLWIKMLPTEHTGAGGGPLIPPGVNFGFPSTAQPPPMTVAAPGSEAVPPQPPAPPATAAKVKKKKK